MAIGACSDHFQYRTPPLNEADQARLTCRDYPEIAEVLAALPEHVFLSGSDGVAVVTPDGRKWIAFDIANQREAALITFGDVQGRKAHFECSDDLKWLAGVWAELQD